MREIPIPFQPPLARKVYVGEKTQTRRLRLICKPGDRLWVREAWVAPREYDAMPPREIPQGVRIFYPATDPGAKLLGKLRPPMFMPRWMCRSVLDVTDVRRQQLQAISLEDAIAEGVHPDRALRGDDDTAVLDLQNLIEWDRQELALAPVARFALLWDTINGKTPGANWTANPGVWAYTFRKVEA